MKEYSSYNVGIYCRLSRDEGSDKESSSIQTQREILKKYVQDNAWRVHDYYVDDGYSGTNFDRPEFLRLISDIEAKNINMVVVKDLSRLGRNYILTGQYTDMYFPDRDVRFIALNDGIDSINSVNDIAPFRNILNQMYSADISRKVSSAVRAKKQKGEFVGGCTPIGYTRDPKNKSRLVIEEEGAAVVRCIYEMAISDMGSQKICNYLTEKGIPSPKDHRQWIDHGTPPKSPKWRSETVIAILRNRMYLGDMVQGIYDHTQFRRKPTKRKPKEEWIITPNTHEALVDKETWDIVQKKISSRHSPTKTGEIQLFAGFVKCKDCGYAMGYSGAGEVKHYTCNNYRTRGTKNCTCHYIRKDEFENVILKNIQKYSKAVEANTDDVIKQICERNNTKEIRHIEALTINLEGLSNRYNDVSGFLKNLYEDNSKGKISDEIFSGFLEDYEDERISLRKGIRSKQQLISEIKAKRLDIESWINLIGSYKGIKELDRAVLSKLIDKIVVGESQVDSEKRVHDVTIH